jgi:hypothetical protein
MPITALADDPTAALDADPFRPTHAPLYAVQRRWMPMF